MLLMGLTTILYEIERNDPVSLIIISFILIGIYGLICIDENSVIHYFFAFIVFICIIFFMIWNLSEKYNILWLSLFLELILLGFIICNIDDNIFYAEIFYILNFAFYYLYLHFLDLIPVINEEDINDIDITRHYN
jgi:hypothetical protein